MCEQPWVDFNPRPFAQTDSTTHCAVLGRTKSADGAGGGQVSRLEIRTNVGTRICVPVTGPPLWRRSLKMQRKSSVSSLANLCCHDGAVLSNSYQGQHAVP